MSFEWSRIRNSGSLESRAINAENRSGAAGSAAAASSQLGPGRKGSAWSELPAGGSLVLADIEGPGVIRHVWITVADRTSAGPFVLRDLVLRAYWDGARLPSVEVPLGDFFCNGFGQRALVVSEPIVVAPTGGMNCYFPMPFRTGARLEIGSEHGGDIEHVFFQIDYTLGDDFEGWPGYFHAHWRRSNGSTGLGEDHLILDGIEGAGTYVGTYISIASLQRYWWGEGEVKFYLDGDDALPTLCSTGLEDYAGGAWAFQNALRSDPPPRAVTFCAPYFGYPLATAVDETRASEFTTATLPMHGLYRWHLPDPVFFNERIRVTVQQIGAWDHGLFERSDDISSTAYWYQTTVNEKLPPIVGVRDRTPR